MHCLLWDRVLEFLRYLSSILRLLGPIWNDVCGPNNTALARVASGMLLRSHILKNQLQEHSVFQPDLTM